MLEDVIIRSAKRKDIEKMVLLLEELFSIEADFQSDPERQMEGITMFLDGCGKHKCIKVAETDGNIVGMCTTQLVVSTAQGTPAALVEDMVVAAGYRKKGIGRKLMQAIESWAKSHGATRLQLLADRTNGPALDFYQSIGWSATRLICLRRMIS
jgi:GNAT superfamily N-acetyltransferase